MSITIGVSHGLLSPPLVDIHHGVLLGDDREPSLATQMALKIGLCADTARRAKDLVPHLGLRNNEARRLWKDLLLGFWSETPHVVERDGADMQILFNGAQGGEILFTRDPSFLTLSSP